jgi:hypothetical protein
MISELMEAHIVLKTRFISRERSLEIAKLFYASRCLCSRMFPRCLGEQFDCGDDRGRPQEAEAEGGGEGEGEGGEEEITPPYQETARGQSPRPTRKQPEVSHPALPGNSQRSVTPLLGNRQKLVTPTYKEQPEASHSALIGNS